MLPRTLRTNAESWLLTCFGLLQASTRRSTNRTLEATQPVWGDPAFPRRRRRGRRSGGEAFLEGRKPRGVQIASVPTIVIDEFIAPISAGIPPMLVALPAGPPVFLQTASTSLVRRGRREVCQTARIGWRTRARFVLTTMPNDVVARIARPEFRSHRCQRAAHAHLGQIEPRWGHLQDRKTWSLHFTM